MTLSAYEIRERISQRYGRVTAPKISFEFFPPKSEKAEASLWKCAEKLGQLAPEFVSVTYGADGSTRDRTHAIVKHLSEQTDIATMPHLTCVGASRGEIDDIADEYWDMGVRRIMALRGDPAGGAGQRYVPTPGGYPFAAELVEGLMRKHPFELAVAAYPEVHPEAPSSVFDLDNLKRKFDAGASMAITQYFFDTDAFLRFRDRCTLAGIEKPIIPGILPVTNFATTEKFSLACGTKVPTWMAQAFEGLDDDPQTRQLIAANIAIEQVLALQSEGIDAFHFYTLNRADLCFALCHALGARPILTHAPADQGSNTVASQVVT